MEYEEAIEKLQQLTKFGFNFGLERIEQLLKLLGNPEKKLKVIHIGGTNGKGSTSAMVASILASAGLKVGLFTSPHLHSYTERIKINGQEIPGEHLAALMEKIIPHFTQMVAEGYEHPTEFEVGTAMALQYFYEQAVDIVVLEVGLGGAIDSTNVVDPLISVITNVSMEHMDYLGNTLTEITTVKAGIIKKGRPVVTGETDDTVLQVIKEKSLQQAAPLYEAAKLTYVTVDNRDTQGQIINVAINDWKIENLHLPLLGDHQLKNCATALTIIKVLVDQYGYNLKKEQIIVGIKNVKWPARMELFGQNPTVLIDGAHNTAGIAALRESLKNLFNYNKLIVVLGMLADKEREQAVALLAPLAHHIIVTKPNSPRADKWQEIALYATKFCNEIDIIEDGQQALTKAMDIAGSNDLICITGSLYMIAEIRKSLLTHK